MFSPCKRSLRIADVFPTFVLAGCTLAFVAHCKYLGHIIENSLSDDRDINREIKLLFARTNVLIRRFKRCSTLVKLGTGRYSDNRYSDSCYSDVAWMFVILRCKFPQRPRCCIGPKIEQSVFECHPAHSPIVFFCIASTAPYPRILTQSHYFQWNMHAYISSCFHFNHTCME